MGRFEHKKLYYICGGLVLGLGILLFSILNGRTGLLLKTGSSSQGEAVSKAAKAGTVSAVPPKANWKNVSRDGGRGEFYDNEYQPSSGYANDYIPDTEVNHPLIASAKFLDKKDKRKNSKRKNDKKKTGLADKAKKDKSDSKKSGLSEDDSTDEDSRSNTTALNTNTNAAAAAALADKKKKEEEEENINTVEFWEKPIFIEEDPTAVKKLIDSYQIKKVSSNVFYTVVTEMNHDERPNIRDLGIDALGSAPSTKSFAQLTWVKHNDAEAVLRDKAIHQLTNYTDVNLLNYVVSSLGTNKEQKVAIEALRTLTDSTVKYGELQAQQTGGAQNQTVKLSQLEPRYTKALEIIEQNYVNSPDAVLKSEATKTAEAITKFMTI